MNEILKVFVPLTISAIAGNSITANIPREKHIDIFISCLEKLGASFLISDNMVCCTGMLKRQNSPRLLDCGSSVDVFSFLLPVAMAFCGDASFFCTAPGCTDVCRRAAPLFNACQIYPQQNGAAVSGRLQGGSFTAYGRDSLLYCGLMLVSPLLTEDSRFLLSSNDESISFTSEAMRRAQISINRASDSITIKGLQKYAGCDTYVK